VRTLLAVKCKTFDSYIKELIYYPQRATKWFADKRLTSVEKKILQGYLQIRNNQSSQVITELKDLPQSSIAFVQDHFHLILGICYNNIGDAKSGEKYLSLAIKGFEDKGEDYHLFTALFNLLNLLGNEARVSEMGAVLSKMEEICPDMKLAKLRLFRSQFIYACDSNQELLARKLITKINLLKADFSESDLAQHLVCEFMFYIKYEELNKAQDIIVQMKKCRNYALSENYHFMNRLLSHLITDSAIYVYEREFPTLTYLFHQMKVIESLQGADRENAEIYWKKLQAFNPDIYKEDFRYHGEKCLFSLCLEKHLNKVKKFNLKLNSNNTPLYKVAFEILTQSSIPLKKGHLFELIYGEVPETKEDDIRLARIISKIRQVYGVRILFKKGSYSLEPIKENIRKNA